jgi:hypothetical protein
MVEVIILYTNDNIVKEHEVMGQFAAYEIKDAPITWLCENNIEWEFSEITDAFVFTFKYLDDAILFKLVWG